MLDEPFAKLVAKRSEDGLRLSCVGKQKVGVSATGVEKVRATQLQALKQLVRHVLQHELQVQAACPELFEGTCPADVIDEALDAAHIP